MKRRKIIRIGAILALAGLLIGGGIGLYMFNMPHRNVQSAQTDFSLTSSQIVSEYLTDKEAANIKYLAADGDSKILEITGVVSGISEDFNGNQVVLLKGNNDEAGVSATFTADSNASVSKIVVGETTTVKGVIRSGAAYDDDLELYENVVLEQSSIINN
ncbi:MAG: hypothetical protein HN778_10945 [Prolixibacteraceae bacterium]|jgi:hypothetical protein|nr:hypothetical protein [Prolixibacteraceae bacterium]MBT6766318.1 hypothetical protein [Prolixibacteraceae bacterium]MBT6997717.1 hypothetical protein [Prolixibacteraceae bacterium]MBT7395338.1 hypothetical protein [Prolixibacteraceae bacterium]